MVINMQEKEREEKNYTSLLKDKLLLQHKVYLDAKAGKRETICYKEYTDAHYGKMDANYKNRMRLAYYLLYEKIDDEEIIAYLFREELEDRETDSFQGIGQTLEVLTSLLKKYNVVREDGQRENAEQECKKTGNAGKEEQDGIEDKPKIKEEKSGMSGGEGKYDDLFRRAKNANFDCACGYDPDVCVDDDFGANDLLDCIYLSWDLDYKDVMEQLVPIWKDSVTEWDDGKRDMLIRFYSFLGREADCGELYRQQLASAQKGGEVFDIIRAYARLIRHFLKLGETDHAYLNLREVLDTLDYEKISRQRLFGDLLEESFEIIQKDPAGKKELWDWAIERFWSLEGRRYGDLYQKAIDAAKALGEISYASKIQQEYEYWWEDIHKI